MLLISRSQASTKQILYRRPVQDDIWDGDKILHLLISTNNPSPDGNTLWAKIHDFRLT